VILVFVILGVTIFFFLWNKLPVELVAILSMLALVFTGVLEVDEALAGFANSTVVTIAALFVVGAGLYRTGVADWIAHRLIHFAGESEVRLTVILVLMTAVFSAFMSNTGTVAVLIPTVISMSRRIGSHPARLLLPMAFAAQLGGMLTLVGTPPNIVLSAALEESGQRPFGFFEFSLVGIPLLAVYLLYVLSPARKLIRVADEDETSRSTTPKELGGDYGLLGRLFRLQLQAGSSLIGKTLEETQIHTTYGVQILDIQKPRPPRIAPFLPKLPAVPDIPDSTTVIEAGSLLIVSGGEESVRRLAEECLAETEPLVPGTRAMPREYGVAEVILTQRSRFNDRSLAEEHFGSRYKVRVLGIRRNGSPLPLPFIQEKLKFGDTLLVYGRWDDIDLMRHDPRNFIVVGNPDELEFDPLLTGQSIRAALCVVGMVGLILTGWVPLVVAVLLTAVSLVLLGCLKMEDAYRAVSWESVLLIAAMIPMGRALQVTGGVDAISQGLVDMLGGYPPIFLLAGIYFLTMIFSQFISNTATAILLAPMAVETAARLDISPFPVLMMVAVGASSAFLTPVASPVNTLVMGPGNYRFFDFARFGLPLMVLVLVVSLLLVPVIWPL
jgi:di/tricarboxylate transporter